MSDPIRVCVVGADGRMGRMACAAVEAAEGLVLSSTVVRGDDLDAALSAVDVLVDLSVPDAAPHHVATAIRRGVHAVVGTTGWDTARLAAVTAELVAAPTVGVLVAPNFSIGAALVQRFAAQAARFYESVEIVELHHPDKADAPSGTATRTAEVIAAARAVAGMAAPPDATRHALPGARGADVAGVAVHSVRLRGLLAHEEVMLGGPGEVLTLRHDSLDRSSFMPGLVLAVRSVTTRPGLTVGLENWLDL